MEGPASGATPSSGCLQARSRPSSQPSLTGEGLGISLVLSRDCVGLSM
jgi:hypothetical protein